MVLRVEVASRKTLLFSDFAAEKQEETIDICCCFLDVFFFLLFVCFLQYYQTIT